MWKCPECCEEIEELNYSVEITRHGKDLGRYILPDSNDDPCNGDHECDDSENSDIEDSDDYNYSCPHCEAEINLSDLENTEEENNDEIDLSDHTKIIFLMQSSRKNLICDGDISSHEIPKYVKCSFCRHIILAEDKKDNSWDDENNENPRPNDTCPNCFKPLLQLKH